MKKQVREAEEDDLEQVAELFQKFFQTHNVFQTSKKTVIAYLRDQGAENKLLVCVDGVVRGACVFVRKGQSPDGSHVLWKYRHFAYSSDETASTMLSYAEDEVRKSSRTAKVELTIAEREPSLGFFRKNRYVREGTLRNHYRWGEICHILGKSFR